MPIPNVTPYPGALPDLADPVTFDARMAALAAWLADVPNDVMTELVASIAAINTALNDNGTVLDAAAAATRRSTNATVPTLTTGTSSAYTANASVTIPSFAAGEPVALRIHTANPGAATLNVNGTGAFAIRKYNSTGALVPLAGGELGAFDEHLFVSDGIFWVLVSQPLRDLLAGPAILPLPSQTGSFNSLIEGGDHTVTGSWTNGPLGSAAATYNAVCRTTKTSDGLIFVQEVTLSESGVPRTYRRVGSGAVPTWGAWRGASGWTSPAAQIVAGTAPEFNHPFGVEPQHTSLFIRCTAAGGDQGYVQNEVLEIGLNHSRPSPALNAVWSRRVNATRVKVYIPNASALLFVPNATTLSMAYLDHTKWELFVKVSV